MNRFYYFIVNKQSRKSDQTFKKLLLEIPKYTNNYKVHITNNIEQLEKLIKQLKETISENDILVSIGGDGSLNHIVTFTEKYHISNPIGYIPSGSGNDFARSNNIPLNTEEAVDLLFSVKEPRKLAIIEASEGAKKHYAVNSMGIGLDGRIINNLSDRAYKDNLGPMSYISQLLSSFKNQDKFPVTLNVEQGTYNFQQVQIVLIANNPYLGGGIKALPEADGTDDILDILVADNVTGRDFLPIVYRLLTNQSHFKHPKLHNFTSKEVALYTEAEQYAQKDGEPLHQKGYAYIIKTLKRDFWI